MLTSEEPDKLKKKTKWTIICTPQHSKQGKVTGERVKLDYYNYKCKGSTQDFAHQAYS